MARKAPAPKEGATATVGDAGLVGGVIPAGTDVTVVGIYPPGTAGVGDTVDGSDAVVIQWDEPALVKTDNGAEVGVNTRTMSVPSSSWSDDFTAGGS